MGKARTSISMTLGEPLRYGENPGNPATVCIRLPEEKDPLSPHRFTRIEGKELGYINFTDLGRAVETIARIAAGYEKNFGIERECFIAVILKHGNACGAAVRSIIRQTSADMREKDKRAVLEAAVWGDPTAAFGGVVITNFELGAEARVLREEPGKSGNVRGYDLIIAPRLTDEAVVALRRPRGGCIMLENAALAHLDQRSPWRGEHLVQVRGDYLVERVDPYVPFITALPDKHLRTRGDPRVIDAHRGNLVLAWAIGSTSNSNSIALVRNHALVVNACGQQSRVGACELAVDLLRRRFRGAEAGLAAYSDGFFPFRDAPNLLQQNGVEVILYPRGSIHDDDIARELENRVALVMLPPHARGFYGHS
ncbi:MAG: hypothetical protein Q8P36_02880 [bacterium]|nr:hypothetical protein [bacterium]